MQPFPHQSRPRREKKKKLKQNIFFKLQEKILFLDAEVINIQCHFVFLRSWSKKTRWFSIWNFAGRWPVFAPIDDCHAAAQIRHRFGSTAFSLLKKVRWRSCNFKYNKSVYWVTHITHCKNQFGPSMCRYLPLSPLLTFSLLTANFKTSTFVVFGHVDDRGLWSNIRKASIFDRALSPIQ